MKSPTCTSRPLFAYVGSYTTPERHGQGNGINVYRVDRRTGAFNHLQHLGGLENPSFLAINAGLTAAVVSIRTGQAMNNVIRSEARSAGASGKGAARWSA